jgi:chromate transporter
MSSQHPASSSRPASALPGQAAPVPASRARPRSRADLFVSFTLLALQGFGGVLAVVQRELVERKQWLTQEEFLEDWAVAQIMPGPNVCNLALMIGGRYFGFAGALTALAGMLAVPTVVVLLLAMLHQRFADNPAMAGALRGMAAVSAGLIGAAALKMSAALTKNPLPPAWCGAIAALGFVLVALLKWPLLYVLLGLGGLGCVLTYRRLKA